jgi:hypothetical protein
MSASSQTSSTPPSKLSLEGDSAGSVEGQLIEDYFSDNRMHSISEGLGWRGRVPVQSLKPTTPCQELIEGVQGVSQHGGVLLSLHHEITASRDTASLLIEQNVSASQNSDQDNRPPYLDEMTTGSHRHLSFAACLAVLRHRARRRLPR